MQGDVGGSEGVVGGIVVAVGKEDDATGRVGEG